MNAKFIIATVGLLIPVLCVGMEPRARYAQPVQEQPEVSVPVESLSFEENVQRAQAAHKVFPKLDETQIQYLRQQIANIRQAIKEKTDVLMQELQTQPSAQLKKKTEQLEKEIQNLYNQMLPFADELRKKYNIEEMPY